MYRLKRILYRLIFIPLRLAGIGRRQNTGPRVQLTDDTRFRDTQRLLLHNFVQHRARAIVHLVELVDTTDTVVGEHQGASLQYQLARFGILRDESGQTDGARTCARNYEYEKQIARLMNELDRI